MVNKKLDPVLEAAKMNAGVFHSRKRTNSPRPVLKGTSYRKIDKKSGRRTPGKKKTPGKRLAQNAGIRLTPNLARTNPGFRAECLNLVKLSGSKKPGFKNKPRVKPKKIESRVDCWRTKKSAKGPKNQVPKISLVDASGHKLTVNRKSSVVKKRRSQSIPQHFSPQFVVLNNRRKSGTSEDQGDENLDVKIRKKSLKDNLLTPRAIGLNLSGGRMTPDMKLNVTLVPRTSSILRSKSQTKRNLKSGSYRRNSTIGHVRGLVQMFEESYHLFGSRSLIRSKQRNSRKRPLEKKPSILDENDNLHEIETPLGLKKMFRMSVDKIDVNTPHDDFVNIEEAFAVTDEVFDEHQTERGLPIVQVEEAVDDTKARTQTASSSGRRSVAEFTQGLVSSAISFLSQTSVSPTIEGGFLEAGAKQQVRQNSPDCDLKQSSSPETCQNASVHFVQKEAESFCSENFQSMLETTLSTPRVDKALDVTEFEESTVWISAIEDTTLFYECADYKENRREAKEVKEEAAQEEVKLEVIQEAKEVVHGITEEVVEEVKEADEETKEDNFEDANEIVFHETEGTFQEAKKVHKKFQQDDDSDSKVSRDGITKPRSSGSTSHPQNSQSTVRAKRCSIS